MCLFSLKLHVIDIDIIVLFYVTRHYYKAHCNVLRGKQNKNHGYKFKTSMKQIEGWLYLLLNMLVSFHMILLTAVSIFEPLLLSETNCRLIDCLSLVLQTKTLSGFKKFEKPEGRYRVLSPHPVDLP